MNKLYVLLLLLIALLQYRLWLGDGNLFELHRLNEQIEELRREGARKRERNAALEAEVMDLKQGLEAIEERARQDLGMIKEGEIFVQVIDTSSHEYAKPPLPASETAPDRRPEDEENAPKRRPRRRLKSRVTAASDAPVDKETTPAGAALPPDESVMPIPSETDDFKTAPDSE